MSAPTPEAIRADALARYITDAEFHSRAYSAAYLARTLSPRPLPISTEQTRRERELAIEAAAIALHVADLPADVLLEHEPGAEAALAAGGGQLGNVSALRQRVAARQAAER